MALDGFTIAGAVSELNEKLTGARLYKIAQPETDELLLTLKSPAGQYRLLMSASASLPLIYLTDANKPGPLTAPNFCMLLRKHLNNGRILSVTQPGLERIIVFEIEHLNELGDLCRKKLIAELMGKHSNIIFIDDNDMILDSIKHISAHVSSVREVLPGRPYFVPKTQVKHDPLLLDEEAFKKAVFSGARPLKKALYDSLTGFSPLMAEELCFRASLDSDAYAPQCSEEERTRLFREFSALTKQLKQCEFTPNIIFSGDEPVEFAPFMLNLYADDEQYDVKAFASVSDVLCRFYASKNAIVRIRQRGSDLRKIVTMLLERNYKKADLQEKQLSDTQKKEKYRLYGEMIHAYAYAIPEGASSFEARNYYTDEPIVVPLQPECTPFENAARYFDRYGKLKRTFSAVTQQLEETRHEILHLESVLNALDIAETEDDLIQIKEELADSGYIRKKGADKRGKKSSSLPFHYLSSDNFHMYAGRNNYQNDELTFKTASGSDWWFHAKSLPGSHVIVKTEGREMTDRAFEEAAALAAYYSKGRGQGKVEIDYVEKKHIKKPGSAKPGFVVYYTNYSMMAEPDISALKKL